MEGGGGKGKRKLDDGAASSSSSSGAKKQRKATPEKPARDESGAEAEVVWFCAVLFDLLSSFLMCRTRIASTLASATSARSLTEWSS